jgi:hypothetical protein
LPSIRKSSSGIPFVSLSAGWEDGVVATFVSIDPDVAPVWRRACAGAIDFALDASGGLVVLGAPVVWAWTRGTDEGITELVNRYMLSPFGEGEVGRRRVEVIDIGTRVARLLTRSRISPGQQLLHIRWAEAASGGDVPVARMAIRELLRYLLRRALGRLNRPRFERSQERHAETVRRIQERHDALSDDPDASKRDDDEIRESATSCLGVMASSCAVGLIEPLTVFLSPRRQSVIERVAGVVMVRAPS